VTRATSRRHGINTPLRQAVHGATFPDATGALQPLAAALTAPGATLRHFDYGTTACSRR